jgi:hypothetical protein
VCARVSDNLLFSEPFTVYKHYGRMTVFPLPVYRTDQVVNTLHKDVLKPVYNKVKSESVNNKWKLRNWIHSNSKQCTNSPHKLYNTSRTSNRIYEGLAFGTYCQVPQSHSVVLTTANDRYSWQPVMAFIMQSPFKFWSATHHTGHLILVQECYEQ